MAKQYYDENGNPVKKKHPILKWGGIAIGVLFVLGIIGSMFGGGDSTNTANSNNNSAIESTTNGDSTNTANSNNNSAIETTANGDPKESYKDDDSLSQEQKNAIGSAINYIDNMPFSKQGLIDQLSSEYGDSFSVDDATQAVQYLEDNQLVDWNEQAVKSAQSYYSEMNMSKENVREQLLSEYGEKYTPEQADYAVEHLE